jgi:hypothetical protein
MPLAHITKVEDARTGQWLRHLDPISDPIHRIDMGWTMGDWNQLDVSVDTVALREFGSDIAFGYDVGLRQVIHVLLSTHLLQVIRCLALSHASAL